MFSNVGFGDEDGERVEFINFHTVGTDAGTKHDVLEAPGCRVHRKLSM